MTRTLVSFDWALKRLLRQNRNADRANFSILDNYNSTGFPNKSSKPTKNMRKCYFLSGVSSLRPGSKANNKPVSKWHKE